MKNKSVIRSAGIVSACTLLSRGLGMIRDQIFAYFFGTTLFASAFQVAFKIPNLFRRLFGEGALSAALIPVLVEERTQRGEEKAWDLIAKVLSLLLMALSGIALGGILLYTIALQFPSLPERYLVHFELARIMFPYVLFICLAAAAMGILNSYKKFALPAFAPCLLNLIMIGVMLGLFPFTNGSAYARIKLLCWGILFAGAAQLAIQLPSLVKLGFKPRWQPDLHDVRVRKILLLMGPAALGAGITQINVLIDGYLATWISAEAPSALFYSERLIYFPLGLIATAMGTVLLPTFSAHAADEDHSGFSQTLSDSLRYLLFIMIPAAVGLLTLAPLILQLVYELGGEFDAASTALSTSALRCYAPGLIVFSLAKIFIPAFYSTQDTRTPVRIGIYTVGLNLLLNITFILTFPQQLKHAGMALATVLAEAVGMTWLGLKLSKKVPAIQWALIGRTALRCGLAAGGMAVFIALLVHHLTAPLSQLLPAKVAQIVITLGAVAVGGAVYFLSTAGLKAPEMREIIHLTRRTKK